MSEPVLKYGKPLWEVLERMKKSIFAGAGLAVAILFCLEGSAKAGFSICALNQKALSAKNTAASCRSKGDEVTRGVPFNGANSSQADTYYREQKLAFIAKMVGGKPDDLSPLTGQLVGKMREGAGEAPGLIGAFERLADQVEPDVERMPASTSPYTALQKASFRRFRDNLTQFENALDAVRSQGQTNAATLSKLVSTYNLLIYGCSAGEMQKEGSCSGEKSTGGYRQLARKFPEVSYIKDGQVLGWMHDLAPQEKLENDFGTAQQGLALMTQIQTCRDASSVTTSAGGSQIYLCSNNQVPGVGGQSASGIPESPQVAGVCGVVTRAETGTSVEGTSSQQTLCGGSDASIVEPSLASGQDRIDEFSVTESSSTPLIASYGLRSDSVGSSEGGSSAGSTAQGAVSH